jgi:hypothetical protein
MQRRKKLWLYFVFVVAIFLLTSTACRSVPGGCAVEDLAEGAITEEGLDMLPKDLPEAIPPIDTLIPAKLATATFALG